MTDQFPAGNQDAAAIESVTREQGGQFIDESHRIIRMGDPLDDMQDMAPDANLVDAGASRINAMQVTMDRSGADFIHAQKVFLTNAGAREISGTSSKLIQSGVLQLTADTVELHQSSTVLAKTGSLSLDRSSAVVTTAENVEMGEGSRVGILTSGSVRADGDVRAFMLFSKDVTAGGTVTTTLSTVAAAAFGAVFGVVVVLLSKVMGRGNG